MSKNLKIKSLKKEIYQTNNSPWNLFTSKDNTRRIRLKKECIFFFINLDSYEWWNNKVSKYGFIIEKCGNLFILNCFTHQTFVLDKHFKLFEITT